MKPTTLLLFFVAGVVFFLIETYVLTWMEKKLFRKNQRPKDDDQDNQCPFDPLEKK